MEPQARVGRDPGVIEGEHERGDRTAVHLIVRPVAAVRPDDVGMVAEGIGVGGWSAELLGPVGGEPLGVMRASNEPW